MDIQTAIIYCFFTMFIIYLVLNLDVKYICKDKTPQNERIIRTSILAGLIIWIIIVYFIYNMENEFPSMKLNGQVLLEGKL
jgi:hypothetical protein